MVKYVYILATLGHSNGITLEEVFGKDMKKREEKVGKRINFNRGPLYSTVEFYTKIRPKVLNYLK